MQTRSSTRRAAEAGAGVSEHLPGSPGKTLKRPFEDETNFGDADKTGKSPECAAPELGTEIRTKRQPKRAKRKSATKKKPQDNEELPHGLGKIHNTRRTRAAQAEAKAEAAIRPQPDDSGVGFIIEGQGSESAPPFQASAGGSNVASSASGSREVIVVATDTVDDSGPANNKKKRVARRTKDNPYGLMPGRTPFPDMEGPSFDQCEEVHKILTAVHGEFEPPEKIPAPSTSVAGCGEVPDLLDAMIRTLISGHTSMGNANLAIQDVIKRYGQLGAGTLGAGSIDWNKVRLSSDEDILHSIQRAGLGPTKAKDIRVILDMVYRDNLQRRDAYRSEKETGNAVEIPGADRLSQGQKDHQLLKIEMGILTMDHIRAMAPDNAMLELTKFPGIGVKTASCLLLFCLQQPSFAVDTHVWRLCKWLGWAPQKASRDDTYMHCELRVPDHLKYGLHQLFIHHGKECYRCRSSTVEGTPEWLGTVCPLEHLLERFDKRKTTKTKQAMKRDDNESLDEGLAEGGDDKAGVNFGGGGDTGEEVAGALGEDIPKGGNKSRDQDVYQAAEEEKPGSEEAAENNNDNSMALSQSESELSELSHLSNESSIEAAMAQG